MPMYRGGFGQRAKIGNVGGTKLTITTQPSSSVTSGVAFTIQPSIQVRDSNNNILFQPGVVVVASLASGSDALSGTLAVTTNSSGVANFTDLVLTGSGADTLLFSALGMQTITSGTVTIGGGFSAPNVLDASFETGWDNFVGIKGGTPGINDPGIGSGEPVTRDNTTAAPGGGSWSVKRHFIVTAAGNDIDGNFVSPEFSPHLDRLWFRFAFKFDTQISSVLKFVRFSETNLGFGGFEIDNGSEPITFWTDQENQTADHFVVPIGITNAQAYDNAWHVLELDYWRNGDPSGFPSAQFWFDGNEQFKADGVVPGNNQHWFWSNKRLNSGERNSSLQLGWVSILTTLNGGQNAAGNMWVDRIAISSIGRIGP